MRARISSTVSIDDGWPVCLVQCIVCCGMVKCTSARCCRLDHGLYSTLFLSANWVLS